MYDEFDRGNKASGNGEYIQVLIQRFEESSQGTRIGNVYDKIGAVRYLIGNGLIDSLDDYGVKIIKTTTSFNIGRMQPTEKGREYLQQKRIGFANAVASVLGTFFNKFAKSI